MRLLVTFLMAAVACVATEKATVAELLRLHHARSPQFQEALVATLDAANIRKGTAIIGEGPDFFWAVEADNQPTLYVDDSPGLTMTRLNGNMWYRAGQLQPGHRPRILLHDQRRAVRRPDRHSGLRSRFIREARRAARQGH